MVVMKKLISLTFVLFITTAFSQVRPTGGGADSETNGGGSFDEDFIKRNKSPETRFKVLDLQISQNDIICTNGERLSNSKTIMDTYYALVLYKSKIVVDGQCDADKAYLKCLNGTSVKLLIGAIKEDKKESVSYLKKAYKLDKKSANQVIDFFSELEKLK